MKFSNWRELQCNVFRGQNTPNQEKWRKICMDLSEGREESSDSSSSGPQQKSPPMGGNLGGNPGFNQGFIRG